jgi:hypothetical protein
MDCDRKSAEGGGYQGMANPDQSLVEKESKHAPHNPITQDRNIEVD